MDTSVARKVLERRPFGGATDAVARVRRLCRQRQQHHLLLVGGAWRRPDGCAQRVEIAFEQFRMRVARAEHSLVTPNHRTAASVAVENRLPTDGVEAEKHSQRRYLARG